MTPQIILTIILIYLFGIETYKIGRNKYGDIDSSVGVFIGVIIRYAIIFSCLYTGNFY